MLARGLAAAFIVAVADQLSKLWILDLFAARPANGGGHFVDRDREAGQLQ